MRYVECLFQFHYCDIDWNNWRAIVHRKMGGICIQFWATPIDQQHKNFMKTKLLTKTSAHSAHNYHSSWCLVINIFVTKHCRWHCRCRPIIRIAIIKLYNVCKQMVWCAMHIVSTMLTLYNLFFLLPSLEFILHPLVNIVQFSLRWNGDSRHF